MMRAWPSVVVRLVTLQTVDLPSGPTLQDPIDWGLVSEGIALNRPERDG